MQLGKASALPAPEILPAIFSHRPRTSGGTGVRTGCGCRCCRSQLIEASVTAVGPVNRAPQRIAVGAQVAYAKTLIAMGRFWRKRSPKLFLTYVLGRDGKE